MAGGKWSADLEDDDDGDLDRQERPVQAGTEKPDPFKDPLIMNRIILSARGIIA